MFNFKIMVSGISKELKGFLNGRKIFVKEFVRVEFHQVWQNDLKVDAAKKAAEAEQKQDELAAKTDEQIQNEAEQEADDLLDLLHVMIGNMALRENKSRGWVISQRGGNGGLPKVVADFTNDMKNILQKRIQVAGGSGNKDRLLRAKRSLDGEKRVISTLEKSIERWEKQYKDKRIDRETYLENRERLESDIEASKKRIGDYENKIKDIEKQSVNIDTPTSGSQSQQEKTFNQAPVDLTNDFKELEGKDEKTIVTEIKKKLKSMLGKPFKTLTDGRIVSVDSWGKKHIVGKQGLLKDNENTQNFKKKNTQSAIKQADKIINSSRPIAKPHLYNFLFLRSFFIIF